MHRLKIERMLREPESLISYRKCLKVDFGNHADPFGCIQMTSAKRYFSFPAKVKIEVCIVGFPLKHGTPARIDGMMS